MLTVALMLASGVGFFLGAPLVAAAAALPIDKSRGRRILARVLMLVGLALIVASAAPRTPKIDAVGAVLVVAWFLFAGPQANPTRRSIGLIARGALVVLSIVAIAIEAFYQVTPKLPRGGQPALLVLGDSVSAGIENNVETWPEILTRRHGVRVLRVARAGATTDTMRSVLDRAAKQPGVAVILLGGNDILAGRPVADFERDLDAILACCAAGRRPVVLFEMPLPPLGERYGRVQRRLAAKYGVHLIPRRRLAFLLATPGATSDGLHLTDKGQAMMAELVWSVIGDALAAPGT